MKALDRFKALYNEYFKWRYPNVPYISYPPYTKKLQTTNGMTKAIISYLRLNGWMAQRTGTMGRRIDNRKVVKDVMGRMYEIGSIEWIKGTGTRGKADISATIAGRMIEIEVKNEATKDKMRPEQQVYKTTIEASGGVYFVAVSFEAFVDWFEATYQRNPNYIQLWEVVKESKNLSI